MKRRVFITLLGGVDHGRARSGIDGFAVPDVKPDTD
jgi:hypothetical protein